jgi:hypothetical protein
MSDKSFDQFCLQWNVNEDEREALQAHLGTLRLQRLTRDMEPYAMSLLRAIYEDYRRRGAWWVPPEIQERINWLFSGRTQ